MRLIKRWIKGSRLEPLARSAKDLITPQYIVIARREHNYMKQLISYVLRENSNCIDVGAHMGDVLEQFLRIAPLGRHIAFEPYRICVAN